MTDQAPPGVTVRLLPRPSGVAWASWLATHPAPMTVWESRPIIVPRLILVHTNGATGEGTAAAAFNWSMSDPSHTKPHYQVDRDGTAVKFLPSNRGGIANYLAAPWSIAIETADQGWPTPGNACGFSAWQGEMVAQIIAYEAELWNIPIAYPNQWQGAGVGSHTEPFGYPHWTNSQGKPCPGTTKKAEMISWIMPRAREILARSVTRVEVLVPTPPPLEGDDDMNTARMVRQRGYLNVWLVGTGPALQLSPELALSYENDGIPMIVQDHAQSLKAMLHQSGLEHDDLVPGGP